MRRRFFTLDVFTDRALCGNPLAVVLDAQALSDVAMQSIAREFNLSETVFVLPPQDPHQRASLRIFTPGRELPFAGHPTVGTAVLLGLLDHGPGHGVLAFGLEEKVGLVACAIEVRGEGYGQATFTLPRLPAEVEQAGSAAGLARRAGPGRTRYRLWRAPAQRVLSRRRLHLRSSREPGRGGAGAAPTGGVARSGQACRPRQRLRVFARGERCGFVLSCPHVRA